MIEQSLKSQIYKRGEIVRYTGYEGDLINYPNKKPVPNRFFKIKKVDIDWGVVDHGKDTIGVAYIRKTNLIEKIRWFFKI